MSDVVLITPPVDRIIITQPAPRVLRETLGPPGPQGPVGPQGDVGPQGPTGANGVSFTWRGAWNSGTAYALNDVVSYNGSSFVAIQVGANHAPAVGGTAYWQDVADKGDVGAQGPVGPQGPQGPQGNAGPQGPQGAVGAQGPQGVRGIGNSTFSLTGVLAVTVGQGRFVLVGAATITSVIASVGTAPTGASIIVDVKKNGVSVFGAGPKPTIAAGANVSAAVVPATTALADGDYLTVDVTQVGSGTPGADLTVQTYLS